MKKLLKYEWYRLIYSYALIYACLICIPLACITNFLIAGAPESPHVYGLAFEFYIPQMLAITVPAVFIANGLKKGKIKTELLSGEKRYKIFISKSILFYLAAFIVFNVYIILLTLFNVKGIGIQTIYGENSFVYFLRCASVGFAYYFMISTVLMLVAVLFKSSTLTVIGGISMFLFEFLLRGTVDSDISDKVVPSLIIEQLVAKSADTAVVVGFSLMVVIISVLSYVSAMSVYCKRDYK